MSDPVEEAAKLPLNQRLEHTHWKVRSVAYEELAKKYNEALESNAPMFHEYSGYFKKMMNDKNAAAMEKGLEPIYAFYDRYDHAAKFTPNLAPLIIEKCLGARQGTKQRATEVLMLMVEVDTTAEPVVLALVEGANNKVPKIAVASIQTLELIIKTFGVKVVPLKPILAAFLGWFEHTNADARAAAQTFTIELYRWVGGAILDKPIANLRQAQVTELQKAFNEIPKGGAAPERYLRCQIDQMQQAAAAGAQPAQVEEIDVFTMVEAVNLLAKITPDIYEALQSKKWKDKKEALENINKIADTPRLQSGEYGELVKNLKRLLGDANVFVVEESVKCLGHLARGLRAEFSHFAKNVMGTLLDKLKEKKDKVIAALQGTFDAFHPHCFALADISEDITTASKHKVPQVKKELLNWVKRALVKEKRPTLTKSLKFWCTLFMELMDDSDSPVRENAFECFGVLIGIVGERSVTGFLNQLDKVKEKRVREFIPANPIPAPAGSAPAPVVSTIDVNANVNLANVAVAKKPAATATSAAPKKSSSIAKPVTASSSSSVAKREASSKAAPSAPAVSKPAAVETFSLEPRVSAGELEGRIADVIPENVIAQLNDKEWKQRLEGINFFANVVEKMDLNTLKEHAESLLLYLIIARPTFKESNVQVLAKMIEILKRLPKADFAFNKNDVHLSNAGFLDHLHEPKLTQSCIEYLNACGENPHLGIQFVFNSMYGITKEQKNPKAIVEALAYMNTALAEFGGALIELRNLVTFVKTVALENNNATIKATGIRVLCECYKHMGGTTLLSMLNDVRPQLMTTIKKEFEKVSAEKPAAPIRGPNAVSSGQSDSGSSSAPMADIPRVDISATINAVIPSFTAADWQKRQEAMAQLESTLIEVRRIQPKGVSSLVMALKSRLADSNINLIPMALNLLGELASASGPAIESHMKTVMPSILGCYANGKSTVRSATSACLDKWVNETGMDPLLSFLPTALGTPSGRAELLGWISSRLHTVKKGDVKVLLKPTFQCYQDKTKEVRTVAEAALIELARRLTAKVVEGECSKLAPSILAQVRTLLKNMEAEIKKVAPAPAGKSKIPLPASLATPTKFMPTSSSSPVASPRNVAEDVVQEVAEPEPVVDTKPQPTGPVLPNNLKSEREKQDLSWIFDQPVPSKFVDALRDQMSGCVTPDMFDRMFSSDAKSHNSAIVDLEASVDSNQQAIEDSLDVILKWASLRLFDSNAAIIKRVLGFFEHLIGTFDIWDHKLSDLEAASFIPIFVLRLAHLNETSQSTVRNLLQQVEQKFYPPSKLFKLFISSSRLWTGTHAVQSSSRVECIRYLTGLLKRQSISVCDPSETFKTLSSLLSEEDDAVVIACLDAFVAVGKSLTENESLWQHISDEHHALIRAYIQKPGTETFNKFRKSSVEETAPAAEPTIEPASPPKEQKVEVPKPVLEKVSISKATTFSLDLDRLEVAPLPANLNISLPSGITSTLLPSQLSADPTPYLPSRQVSRTANAQSQKQSQLGSLVQSWIMGLKSPEALIVCQTLGDISAQFQKDLSFFTFHLEALVPALAAIMKSSLGDLTPLGSSPTAALAQVRAGLITVLTVLFSNDAVAKYVSPDHVKIILAQTLEMLTEAGNQGVILEQGEKEGLISALNALAIKILNSTDRTATITGLIQQLREKIPKDMSNNNLLEVVKKCLSRMTKIVPNSISKLSVSAILYEIHLLFTQRPPHTWQGQPSQSAFDTVKSLLDVIVKVTGFAIISQLSLIPRTVPAPAINWYLRNLLKVHCPGVIEANSSVLETIAVPDENPETHPISVAELNPTGFSQDTSSQLARLRSLQGKLQLPKPTDQLQVDFEPSSLAAIASASASAAPQHSLLGSNTISTQAGGAKPNISGLRERLRNVASSSSMTVEAPTSKFDLPSLSSTISQPLLPTFAPQSTLTGGSSSFALPTLSAGPSGLSSSVSVVADEPPKPVSNIPLGPASVPTSSAGSTTVESLRERLARIKNNK